jgi:hypothetical protein
VHDPLSGAGCRHDEECRGGPAPHNYNLNSPSPVGVAVVSTALADAPGNGNTGTIYGATWATGSSSGNVDDFGYADSPLNHNWHIYAGSGTLATVTGSGRPGRVLRATTSEGTGFGIRYPPSGSLDLPLRDVSVWIKDTNTFYFYVQVHATDGNMYEPTSGSPYPSGSYAIVPVGTQYKDGTWRELRQDLDADLRTVFGVGVEYVRHFCIRGNYDLDELMPIGREERSYYYTRGQRIATRRDGVVYYLHTDHGREPLEVVAIVAPGTGVGVAAALPIDETFDLD